MIGGPYPQSLSPFCCCFRSILKKWSRNSSRTCSRSGSVEDLDAEGKLPVIDLQWAADVLRAEDLDAEGRLLPVNDI
jgi:hypothetical protein